MSPPVKRILFVGWTRVGDAVMSTSLIAHLLEAHPEARLTLVCGPLAREVLHTVPRVERLIVLGKRPWNMHWLALLRELAGSRWDLVVDLRDSAVSYLVRSPRKWRFRKAATPRRRVEELAALARLATPPWPRLWLAPEHGRAAETLLPAGVPLIAVAPGAGQDRKIWPTARFADLLARLTAAGPLAGARILAVGAPGEEALSADLAARLGPERVVDLVGRRDLLTQAACVARCGLFVGNDSGFTHVAAALGVPTLAVFGPTDPRQYAPFGPCTGFVGGTTDGPPLAITEVTVEAVEQAVLGVLAVEMPT